MNIAICDDEQQVTEQVKNILEMLQIKYDVELKIFQFCWYVRIHWKVS